MHTLSVPIETVRVAGIDVATLSTPDWVTLLLEDHRRVTEYGARPRYHTAINGNVVSVHARSAEVQAAFARADAIAADGVPIMIAAKRLKGIPIRDRAATTDLFHDLAAAAEQHGLSMYFLGATETENAAAVAEVQRRYPRLRIAGRQHGYFSEAQEPDIVAAIQAAAPDVLWVGLGMPREDLFVVRNLSKFQGTTWVKTCGGLFNFLSGANSRAPMWMRDNGLEWLYRTILEPRRLFWRYATTNLHAIWLMLTTR